MWEVRHGRQITGIARRVRRSMLVLRASASRRMAIECGQGCGYVLLFLWVSDGEGV
jgi:hypothetical protein